MGRFERAELGDPMGHVPDFRGAENLVVRIPAADRRRFEDIARTNPAPPRPVEIAKPVQYESSHLRNCAVFARRFASTRDSV